LGECKAEVEGSVNKVESHAFVSVEETDKLAEVGRRHIIVDGVEISMIGDVQRIGAQPEVM
jgi:hypothetical protein